MDSYLFNFSGRKSNWGITFKLCQKRLAFLYQRKRWKLATFTI